MSEYTWWMVGAMKIIQKPDFLGGNFYNDFSQPPPNFPKNGGFEQQPQSNFNRQGGGGGKL